MGSGDTRCVSGQPAGVAICCLPAVVLRCLAANRTEPLLRCGRSLGAGA